MSMTPEQIQQMLLYKQQFPGATPEQAQQMQALNQLQQAAGTTQPGVNRTAGAMGAASQLVIALLKAQKQNQIQKQLQQQQSPASQMVSPAPVAQGTTLMTGSSPGTTTNFEGE
jgi:hypothetical protein